jgi:hypothetical protein
MYTVEGGGVSQTFFFRKNQKLESKLVSTLSITKGRFVFFRYRDQETSKAFEEKERKNRSGLEIKIGKERNYSIVLALSTIVSRAMRKIFEFQHW